MKFRPCIDIHNGKVKQIVGGSLTDVQDQASENFVSGICKKRNCFSSGVWVENDHRGCVGFPDKSTERTGF